MAESQSLVPVAAIVDLILGFVTIALVRRSGEKEWVEKHMQNINNGQKK